MKKIHTLLFLLIISWSLNAQLQNNIWMFGDHAGVNFNSGSPVSISGCALNTAEGTASIADVSSGNLLFYTDGVTVFNRNNVAMPNGSGLFGNQSTTQAALIVPIPGNQLQYYVFSIYQLGGVMSYSIVDMTLQSGLGDVLSTAKNIVLHPAVSEKQQAVMKCDGNIWLISHEWGTNKFFADLITSSGISPSVVSSIGTVHAGGSSTNFNSVGQMKLSQQGDKLAVVMRDLGYYELFDFDKSTGVVSNPIDITSGLIAKYGTEFSPDGTKLYCSSCTGGVIYQYDLSAGSASAIAASATLVGSFSNWTSGMQLATDGKIYIAQTVSYTVGYGYLGVINSPNMVGVACNYVSNGVYLGGNKSIIGIPAFMLRTTSPVPPVITASGLTLWSSYVSGNQWYLNGVLIPGATGQTYNMIASGTYTVVINSGGCTVTSEVYVFTSQGIEQSEYENLFKVYPIPSSNVIHVCFQSPTTGVLTIINPLGQMVFSNQLKSTDGETIDLSNTPRGIYFIHIKGDKVNSTKKIILAD